MWTPRVPSDWNDRVSIHKLKSTSEWLEHYSKIGRLQIAARERRVVDDLGSISCGRRSVAFKVTMDFWINNSFIAKRTDAQAQIRNCYLTKWSGDELLLVENWSCSSSLYFNDVEKKVIWSLSQQKHVLHQPTLLPYVCYTKIDSKRKKLSWRMRKDRKSVV